MVNQLSNILDTYSLVDQNGTNIFLNETNISNSYEKSQFFKRYSQYNTTQWIDVEDGKAIIYSS